MTDAASVPIRGNAWDSIPVPDIGEWHPTLTVSVVIPFYQAPAELDITLAGLGMQTYPTSLLEVIVADDGSDPPLSLIGERSNLNVKVVHQNREGFGLARARNLGAKTGTGDILVFLDCDMVPERHHIEAHARWHHVIDYALVFGLRRHVSFEGIDAMTVANAIGTDRLGELFASRSVQEVRWITNHLDRTDQLRSDSTDPWRVTSGGNLSVRRDFFWEIGGIDESFRQWGGEDNEFGHRAYVHGAVVIPEPHAMAWHQGEGHEPTEQELISLEDQRPKLANLIPESSMRRSRTGRSYTVPMMTVKVTAFSHAKVQTLSVVESVLAGRFSDLVVFVEMSDQDRYLEWMRRQFVDDPRVRVGTDLDPMSEIPAAPIRVDLPDSVLVSVGTLEKVFELLSQKHLGALHITHPDWGNARETIEAFTTRAWQRAKRVANADSDFSEVIGDLFGERWISGISYGFVAADESGLPKTEKSWLSELDARDEHIRALSARRSLRTADAAASTFRARSLGDLGSALRELGSALFGRPEA